MIAEYNGSSSLQRRYVFDPASGSPMVWYEGTGTSDRRFIHEDERGSVVATSNSSGTMLSIDSYDEYGIPASTNTGRFGYTGQAWLPEIGMWYYHNRMYDSEEGRFPQTDRMGYRGGMNLYAYVGGDPVNFTDPLGLERACFTFVVIVGRFPNRDDPGGTNVFQRRQVCGEVNTPGNSPFTLHPGDAFARYDPPPQNATCEAAVKVAGQNQSAIDRAKAAWDTISNAGRAHGIDPALLAAVGVRETGFQNVAEAGGGRGMGVFQLTNQPGVTSTEAYDLPFSANYAARMLASNMAALAGAFPNFTPPELLQATAASYNFGIGNISGNPDTIDVGTSHNNYGQNVLNLMLCF